MVNGAAIFRFVKMVNESFLTFEISLGKKNEI